MRHPGGATVTPGHEDRPDGTSGAGARRAKGLLAVAAEYAEQRSLRLLAPYPNLSYNYVAPALCGDGTRVVLKVGTPGDELSAEAAALRFYDGAGCVRLLDADVVRGALLLERLAPGTPLTTLADEANDERATEIAASVMRALWRPAPPEHEFPTADDWARGFERLRARFGGGSGPLPAEFVEEAETLSTELLASSASPVVLHGDLHHDNILAAERAPWLAIDPKGVIGEPAYEAGALLRNLWLDRHRITRPGRLLERRVRQLAEELDLDRQRVRGWAVAQAVLAAWWCVEDGDDCWEHAIHVAGLLASLR